jgi:3-oxoacyl-(acyl-carrier-protein) synthase
MDRAAKLLLHAGHEAWQQAGWVPDENTPLVLGTTGGGMRLGEALYRQSIALPRSRCSQASRVVHYQPQRQAMDLAEALGHGETTRSLRDVRARTTRPSV